LGYDQQSGVFDAKCVIVPFHFLHREITAHYAMKQKLVLLLIVTRRISGEALRYAIPCEFGFHSVDRKTIK
jgi:hypothetical protein